MVFVLIMIKNFINEKYFLSTMHINFNVRLRILYIEILKYL
jgi:hypothetical protein